jgi:antitoxin ChpS
MEGLMPHSIRLRKVGGSVMLAIPPALLDALDLKSDATVGMSIKAGKLVIEPKARKRYTLDDLLTQCSPDETMDANEHAWVNDLAAGREII